MPINVRRKVSPSQRKCPKCGAPMSNRACTKCNYSASTAYKNRREAKEYTYAGD